MSADSTTVKLEPMSNGMVSVSDYSPNGLVNGSVFSDSSNASSPDDRAIVVSSPSQLALASSTMSPDQENGDVKKTCLVCGDVASGYHYGVASCEACKAFFKRTIQGNIEYTCPANANCEINKRRRKACQACRFKKCLLMGMLREGVRLDRVRGGRQKYHLNKRPPDSTYTHVVIAKRSHPYIDGLYISENELVTSLLEAEPERLQAQPDLDLPISDIKLMATLSDLADRELVSTIGWAKQVPGFFTLSLADQMNLLQWSWIEILNLSSCFRSCPYTYNFVFAEDFSLTEEDILNCNGPVTLDKYCRKLAQRLTNLRVTKEEYVLLKALVLFNVDANVDDVSVIEEWRNKYHDALLQYSKTYHPGDPRRVGNLLLCLPLLSQIKYYGKQYWWSVKKDGRVPLHKLFLEMLDAE